MAANSTLGQCLTVFLDIMEYEGVNSIQLPGLFSLAWAALSDRGRQPQVMCAGLASISLCCLCKGVASELDTFWQLTKQTIPAASENPASSKLSPVQGTPQ